MGADPTGSDVLDDLGRFGDPLGGSNIIEGAGTSFLFVISQMAGALIVFMLSIRHGSGSILQKENLGILVVATIGGGTWFLADTAVFALALSIGVSALAGVRKVWKAYVLPSSETKRAWCHLFHALGDHGPTSAHACVAAPHDHPHRLC